MIRASIYTVEKIGPNQELTPEGFLLCRDVPVARTGMMIYGPEETPIEPGPDGIVKIFRNEEDVFSQATIASAIGKPVTNDHPEEDVTPANWKGEAHGVALNVRRGEGAMDDLLLMDLMITTTEGIEAVQSGKREISLGYDADYEITGDGMGKQSNIIINHIALVEQGRCGSRCAIKDQKPNLEATPMAKSKKTKGLGRFYDYLFRAHKAKDAEEISEIAEEMAQDEALTEEERVGMLDEELGGSHIHIHAGSQDDDDFGGRTGFSDDDINEFIARNDSDHDEFRSRLEALEAKLAGDTPPAAETLDEEGEEGEKLEEFLKDEAPEGVSEEEVTKARDSRYLKDSFKDTIALAEILSPGIRIPTFDSAAAPVVTAKRICKLRKQALDMAYGTAATRPIIEDLMNGKVLDTSRMTCDAARVLFRSAAAVKRNSNASGQVRDSIPDMGRPAKKPVMTLAELNELNKQSYSSKK
jgi:hypothetical protein